MCNGQDCYMNFVCFSITCSNVRLNSATKRKGKEKESNCPEERVRRGKGTQNSILPLLDLEKKYKVSLTQHSLPFLCSVFLSLVWTLTSSEAPSALSCPPCSTVLRSASQGSVSVSKILSFSHYRNYLSIPLVGEFKSSTEGICGRLIQNKV